MTETLVDTKAIATLLGVTREHVTDRLTKRPDFPLPTLNRSQRLRRWRESDILAWAGIGPQSSREAISEAVAR